MVSAMIAHASNSNRCFLLLRMFNSLCWYYCW